MKAVKDNEKMKVPGESITWWYKDEEYTTAGTYTFNITEPSQVYISLIGGGGGSAQVDGYGDPYSDTARTNHYGHSGGNGGRFEGWANLGVGTLQIKVGAVGTNRAGQGVAAGNGGDSYAVYTPENGTPVEIARARGGHSGYPDGSTYMVDVPGGTVTYDPNYFSKIEIAQTGASGHYLWVVHI